MTANSRLRPLDAAPAERSTTRIQEAAKQLLCGGFAGSVAKTVTAPFSRLTILFQVHSLVTTKHSRPRFAMSLRGGVEKIIERGGVKSLWRGNMTSVLHRFPYSAINFFVYENTMDALSATQKDRHEAESEKQSTIARRLSHHTHHNEDEHTAGKAPEDTPAVHKFISGAAAGTMACCCCYPLDLVRTRLTTELEGAEHYRGILDAFRKIYRAEGIRGFYAGIGPTLLVAIPNFSISYTVYGTLKESMLDDDLFYNLRKIDADSGEPKLGFGLTILCGASSGVLASLVTFPMDTIRRRMQIQNLHLPEELRMTSRQQFTNLFQKEGLSSLYRGLTPELLKVVPMVGTMFVVYEWTKEVLNVQRNR
jgi:solute carrier family 25 phosphate transporter 23/24/25/41